MILHIEGTLEELTIGIRRAVSQGEAIGKGNHTLEKELWKDITVTPGGGALNTGPYSLEQWSLICALGMGNPRL